MKIFEKQSRLEPSAMRTVAQRRFDDATALSDTDRNAHANGVAYLAGFVIEILLKAMLVKRFAVTARKRHHEVEDEERLIWSLIWRKHDLAEMVDLMPEFEAALDERGRRDGVAYNAFLKSICGTWTIQARYSPFQITMGEAREMLEQVRLLKERLT